ncbi:MAG: T9SS type A sorting domain-containing protein [Saprospiraceae bacterium]
MKRSKFTSFLFTIALGLFAFNFSSAQTSADCQDEINLSVGAACSTAIPWEAFNTWQPSCMLIKNAKHQVMAAIVGSGTGITAPTKFACAIPVDSVYFEVLQKTKTSSNFVSAWRTDCPLTGIFYYVLRYDWEQLPANSQFGGCSRTFRFRPAGGSFGTAFSAVVILIDSEDDIPTCAHNATNAVDGEFEVIDRIVSYTTKTHIMEVMRSDTFSHTEGLRWVRGTQMLNISAITAHFPNSAGQLLGGSRVPTGAMGVYLVHGGDYKEGKKHVFECYNNFSGDFFTLRGNVVAPGSSNGAKALTPGTYKYESYTQDGTNACWGNINVEYKLWPSTPGRSDTISCVDLSDYDRADDYDYHPTTARKLEDVCAWAELITRPTGNTLDDRFSGFYNALRTAGTVQSVVNSSVRHCYAHTVTSSDAYIKNYDWLCDTMFKVRTFYVDHPGSGGKISIKELAKDSLYITPIAFEDVYFPDSTVVLKCGIIDEYDPEHLAEYLYHAFVHNGGNRTSSSLRGETPVIVGFDLDYPNKYVTGNPCALFSSQYDGPPGIYLPWSKVFQHASYNNYGVKTAYPYVKRKTKTYDPGLRAKIGTSTGGRREVINMDSIYIPVNKVVCNIAATKIDLHPIEICPGDYKFFRTWTILDWCTGTTSEKTQIIKVVDLDAPVILAINGQSPNPAGDFDDDNSKGQEDHYFGDNSRDNTDSAEDGIDPHGNVVNDLYDYNTHYVKVTNPWGCYASYTFPYLTLREHCSTAGYNFEWNGGTYSAGDVVSLSWYHGAPKHHVKINLWDECDNDDDRWYQIDVIDKLPPVVVLHDELIVTLTSNNEDFVGSVEHGPQGTPGEGIAKIYCQNVDAGSHDGDCGDLQDCAIRRKGSGDAWEDFVHFTCDDIGQVQVEYRATDWSGNTAIGWMTVTIEQKNGPYITCEDIIIECDDPIHPDWVGYPHAFGICEAPAIEYEDDYHVDDLCYYGYIDRTWRITGTDVQCVQTITITSDDKDGGGDNSVFDPRTIHWPLHNNGKTLKDMDYPGDWVFVDAPDAHGVCVRGWTAAHYGISLGSLSMDSEFECEQGSTKEPTWIDPVCGLVGKTFNDLHIKFNDGVCFKLLRTWTVIDWCAYDSKQGNIYPNENVYQIDFCSGKSFFRVYDDRAHDYRDGYYTFEQEILVVDKTQPVITAVKKDTVEVGAGSKTDDAACTGVWTGTASAEDFCGGVNVSDVAEDDTKTEGPELDWEVKLVRIDKETGKETTIHGFITVAEGGNEYGHQVVYSHENQSPTATYSFQGATHEIYHLKWRVIDGCNNRAEKLTVIYFIDVKAPVLLCYADLSTNAMSTNGEAEVWANDYGHAFDCDGEEVPVWFKDADGNLVPSLTFKCADLDGNTAATKEFNVYAVDEKGNEGFCEVTLRIVDSNNACENSTGAALIAGNVRTESGDMVESAEVTMGQHSDLTGVTGEFAFANNPMGLNYTLEAVKNDDHLNGVSTLDLVLIQKHILGLETLDSPYKVIAADINNDTNVSAIDLVELRKVILGITNEFANNTSWRFSDANVTVDPANPFATFVDAININFLTANVNNDFIAVKIGDVSGNAIANSTLVDSRSNATVAFTALDRSVKAGDLVSISFESADFVGMNAFQFTLNTAGLEYIGVLEGAVNMSADNVAINGNGITAAWSSVNPITASSNLFTLEFRAITDVTLSNAISMTSSITNARAYNSELERFETTLAFNSEDGSTIGAAFELMQNSPNPFQNATTIGFNLGEAGPATLTVFDVTGKTVRVEAGNFERGYNEITLSKSLLGTSGVLYYQLESGDFTATRKMIVID